MKADKLLLQAVLAETAPKEGKPEASEKAEGEESLGDMILNNVVDQLLEGTLPANSAANILVSSSHDDMDTLDVVSRPMPHIPLSANGKIIIFSSYLPTLRSSIQ